VAFKISAAYKECQNTGKRKNDATVGNTRGHQHNSYITATVTRKDSLITSLRLLPYVLLPWLDRDVFSPTYSCHGYIVTFSLLSTPVPFPENVDPNPNPACQHFLACIQKNYNKLSMISRPIFLGIRKNIKFFGEKPGRNSCMETLALTSARNSTSECLQYCLPPHIFNNQKTKSTSPTKNTEKRLYHLHIVLGR
jgi:hypothetical protein